MGVLYIGGYARDTSRPNPIQDTLNILGLKKDQSESYLLEDFRLISPLLRLLPQTRFPWFSGVLALTTPRFLFFSLSHGPSWSLVAPSHSLPFHPSEHPVLSSAGARFTVTMENKTKYRLGMRPLSRHSLPSVPRNGVCLRMPVFPPICEKSRVFVHL